MKLKLSLLALTLLATGVVATLATQDVAAGATKVMVIHVTDEIIVPGDPFTGPFPAPGVYGVNASGKIIEVADNAAQVLAGKGDLLVSEVFGAGAPTPQKGDNVSVAYLLEVFEDGSMEKRDFFIISID